MKPQILLTISIALATVSASAAENDNSVLMTTQIPIEHRSFEVSLADFIHGLFQWQGNDDSADPAQINRLLIDTSSEDPHAYDWLLQP